MLASVPVQVLGCLFISHFYCGNLTRSLVETGYLLGASVHLLFCTSTHAPSPNPFSLVTKLLGHVHNWVSRSISSAPRDVRDHGGRT